MNSLQAIIDTLTNSVDHLLREWKIHNYTKKIKHRDSNTILSWNIFPVTVQQLEFMYQELCKIFKEKLRQINGEVIWYEGLNGEIWDRQFNQFTVQKAFISEVYWYDPEIFGYVRILHEKDKYRKEKEWISVDIDVVVNSAWFYQ